MPKAKPEMTMAQMLKAVDTLRAQLEAKASAPRMREAPAAPKISPREEEMLLAAAKESLRQFGTLVPPKEALYTVMDATCPHCGHEGPLATDFGFKKAANGKGVKPQSWCRWCRGSPDSHPTRRGK